MTAPLTPAEERIAKAFFALLSADELHQATIFALSPNSGQHSRFRPIIIAENARRIEGKPSSKDETEERGTPVTPLRRFRIEE